MSKASLRRKLSKLFKKHGYGRLFTCSKFAAYRMLNSAKMRSMINFLSLKPGDKNYDYGTNQIIKEIPKIEFGYLYQDNRKKTKRISIGYCASQADQVKYESGYWACGCGNWSCYLEPLKSKQEIVDSFKESLLNPGKYPSKLAKIYFDALEKGIDLLTEDGFLIKDWQSKANA